MINLADNPATTMWRATFEPPGGGTTLQWLRVAYHIAATQRQAI